MRVYHIPPSLPKVQRIFLKRERKTMRARGIGAKDETEYPGLVRTGLSMNSHRAVVAVYDQHKIKPIQIPARRRKNS